MPHGVRFRGPRLSRRARAAFGVAGISLLERREDPGWGRQVVEYVVAVDARNPEEAIAKVSGIVSKDGWYEGFAPDPP